MDKIEKLIREKEQVILNLLREYLELIEDKEHQDIELHVTTFCVNHYYDYIELFLPFGRDPFYHLERIIKELRFNYERTQHKLKGINK